MKVIVFLNKIKIDYITDFSKAQQYFTKNGVPVEFEFQTSNIKNLKVIEEDFGASGKRLELTGHETQIPLSKDFITIFAFNGNDYKNIPTSKCGIYPNGILLTLMTYKDGDKTIESYLTIIHEMMHAIRQLILAKGIAVNDVMDLLFKNGQWLPYYKNDHPDDIDSNFGEQWKLFKPYLYLLNPQPMDLKKWGMLPALETKAIQFLTLAKSKGYDLKITQGWRDPSYQDKLYAQGRTIKGTIVTNATGKTSKHCLGKAFDIAFTGAVPYPAKANWTAIGVIGESCGLVWGGRFKSFVDLLHFEI